MDAVESPLQASVVVSKLLDPEVFHRIGGSGSGDLAVRSSSADGRGSGSVKAQSGGFSVHRDIKHPATGSDHGCGSRNRKSIDVSERLLPSTMCEANGKRQNPEKADTLHMSSPQPEYKKMQKKSLKSPCSKRPRTDQPENSLNSFLTKCTTSDKSRPAKQKGSQDVKRCERKNFRGAGKTKLDCFTAKNGSTCLDFAVGGNNVLGIYGLKPDFHDVTKDMDEPSLTELLDGSYKCPNACQNKGRRVSSVNENILLSVRKACSILQSHGYVDCSSKRDLSTCPLNSNSCSTNIIDQVNENKCIEETVLSNELVVQESKRKALTVSPFYQPKDILEQLALSMTHDLDSLLRDQTMTSSAPSHSNCGISYICGASLPPFSWSSSQYGSCKPTTETGKLATNRYACQGRWVRIGSSPSSVGDDHSCFSGTDQKTHVRIGDPSKQQKVDDLLEEVKTMALAYSLPYCSSLYSVTDAPASNILNSGVSCKSSGILRPDNSFDLNLLDTQVDSSDRHPKLDSRELGHRMLGAEGGFQCRGNKSSSTHPSESSFKICASTVMDEEYPAKGAHGGLDNNSYSFVKSAMDGYRQHQWKFPKSGISKAGYSPRLLAAAEILCEMAIHTDIPRKQNHDNGKIRWPNTPLQVTMKARKSRPLLGNTDGPSVEAKSSISVEATSRTSSPRHKLMTSDKKSKLLSMNNVGRGPVRWTVSGEGTFPLKLDSAAVINGKQFYRNSIRQMDLPPSSTRVQQVSDGHQKLRKGTVTTASYTNAVICTKDWSRGSKRG